MFLLLAVSAHFASPIRTRYSAATRSQVMAHDTDLAGDFRDVYFGDCPEIRSGERECEDVYRTYYEARLESMSSARAVLHGSIYTTSEYAR